MTDVPPPFPPRESRPFAPLLFGLGVLVVFVVSVALLLGLREPDANTEGGGVRPPLHRGQLQHPSHDQRPSRHNTSEGDHEVHRSVNSERNRCSLAGNRDAWLDRVTMSLD